MKYRIHIRGSNVTIKAKLAIGEKINEREVDYLLKNAVPGFFQISYDGKKQLMYDAPGSLSLEKYLKDTKSPIEEKAFWKMIIQMLDVEIAAQNRGLYPDHMLMKPDAIFMEEDTLKMYFVYQPVTGMKDLAYNLFALIQDIIYQEMKKNGGKGPDYLIDFQDYLQQGDYRPEHVRQYIAQVLSGRRPGIGSQAIRQPVGEAEAEEPEQYTVMLGSRGKPEPAMQQKKKNMQLIRVRTKERTEFTGDVVKIGRSSQNTYCITGNTSFGRNHAAIVRRGDVCYLKDMGSVNGTSVNGKRLMENQACKLHSGDRIQLADEEFVFELQLL